MSLLIDNEIFRIAKPTSLSSIPKNEFKSQILKSLAFMSQLTNRTFEIIRIEQVQIDSKKCLKIIIAFNNKLFGMYDIWYTINLDANGVCFEEKIQIAKNQFIYKIQPFKKKLLALRVILCSQQAYDMKYCKIVITNQGIITLQIPKLQFNNNLTNTLKPIKKIQKSLIFCHYVQNVLDFVLNDTKQVLKRMLQSITNVSIKQEFLGPQLSSSKQKNDDIQDHKFQLYRYLIRSSIQLRFDCTQGSALYQQVVIMTITQQRQIQSRVQIINFANQLRLQNRIYLQVQNIFGGIQKQVFYMNVKQKQETKALLQIPQIIPIKPNQGQAIQNKYMYNNVVLQLQKQIQQLNLLAESGFGRIQYGYFSFWYIMTTKSDKQDEQILKQHLKIRKKILVVKSPKGCEGSPGYAKFLNKQLHEIKIINRLRGLSCALIPRFYQVQRFFPPTLADVHKNPIIKYHNTLLVELTSFCGEPGFNLGNLIEDRGLTLGLKNVIYILSQIAQAIRFLHLNKIVHLDLKPENILITKNYGVKLIDFGEAFHPLVPYEDSTPAYTYPYGCPEIAQQPQFFSEKSDVFEFGIMLFQMLYGRDIITTRLGKLLKLYKNKTYIKRIFFNPEELEQYGQNFILPMLNNLIIKSLSPNPDQRPSMTWISVLLKNFMEMLP